jgi:hypothetical protein
VTLTQSGALSVGRLAPAALLGLALLAAALLPHQAVDAAQRPIVPFSGALPAPHAADPTGSDLVTALGCQREQQPGAIPTSVLLVDGHSSRKIGFDQAWALTHQAGNTWRVVGFCYR